MKKKIVLLLLAFCTSNLFAQDIFCDETTCPEEGVRGNTWPNHNLYYYIYNYPNNSPITSTQYLTVIGNAFSTWSQYTDFTFTRTYNSSQANITLLWESSNNGCAKYYSTATAHSSDGNTGSAYIHFNDEIIFTMTSPGNILEAVALREIGHTLGLDYIPNQPSAAMYNDNVTITDLTGYDLHEYYVHYEFPWSLTGSKLIYSSERYDIFNLPSYFTTSWSLLNDHYNTGYNLLIQNYYGQGTCIIVRDQTYNLMDDTLTATIKKDNVEVKQLSLSGIYAYDDFWGRYSSGNLSGEINYTHVFNVKTNTNTSVFSPNFYGATVLYSSSGATPTSWNPDLTNGWLYFTTSTPSVPVVINVTDGCGNSYTLYAFGTSQYKLNVSSGEGEITVSLVEDGDSDRGISVNLPWTVEVRNAATGRLMATRSSTSRSETISTVGWPKGIYVVKATIGDEELTEKVIVK